MTVRKTDALHDLIRTVGDDSPAEHKAIFYLWAALDDIEHGRPLVTHVQHHVARAFEAAASALATKDEDVANRVALATKDSPR